MHSNPKKTNLRRQRIPKSNFLHHKPKALGFCYGFSKGCSVQTNDFGLVAVLVSSLVLISGLVFGLTAVLVSESWFLLWFLAWFLAWFLSS